MPFKCLTFGVVVVSFLQIRFLFLFPPFCLHEADRSFGVAIECVAAIHITGS